MKSRVSVKVGTVLTVAVLVGCAVSAAALAAAPAIPTITPQALKSSIDAKKAPVIFDVRTPDIIASVGKIPGATVLSPYEVMENKERLPKAKNAEIVVYSDTEATASMVALALTQLLGYSNVKILKGGFNAWDSLAFPYEEWQQPHAAPIPGGC